MCHSGRVHTSHAVGMWYVMLTRSCPLCCTVLPIQTRRHHFISNIKKKIGIWKKCVSVFVEAQKSEEAIWNCHQSISLTSSVDNCHAIRIIILSHGASEVLLIIVFFYHYKLSLYQKMLKMASKRKYNFYFSLNLWEHKHNVTCVYFFNNYVLPTNTEF